MHARSTRDANRQKGDPAIAQPDNETKRQPDRRGVPGEAEEDRGGEGCTSHIRIAIVQLSGVQYGIWIIITMNTSVWPN